MKSKKHSNSLKSLFQYTASHGGVRLLSVVLAALLCCGANSQVFAASMPIGANYAANPTSSTTSSDQLDVTGMLRENTPDASNQQPWTLAQKVEGLFVGLATLGGLVAGGKMFYNRQNPDREGFPSGGRSLISEDKPLSSSVNEKQDAASITEQLPNSPETLKIDVTNENTPAPRTWGGALNNARQAVWDAVTLKRCFNRTASCDGITEDVETVTSPITSRTWVEALAAWRQKGWANLTALFSARRAPAVLEKTFLHQLTEKIAEDRRSNALKSRTWLQFLSQIVGCSKLDPGSTFSDLHHGFNATRSGTLTAEALKKISTLPSSGLSTVDGTNSQDLEAFTAKINQMRQVLLKLSTKDDADTMLTFLSHFGISDLTKLVAESYSDNTADQRKFIYYVAKHQDVDEPITEDKLVYIKALLESHNMVEGSSGVSNGNSLSSAAPSLTSLDDEGEDPIIRELHSAVNNFWHEEALKEAGTDQMTGTNL